MGTTWNDRIKAVVEALSSKIPYVGAVVKCLVDMFWPSSDKNIWDCIKEQVIKLIDVKILEMELEERSEELNGLKDSMNQYAAAQNIERGSWMSTMLNQANVLYHEFVESSNAIHLIPLAITTAHMHLTLLLERYTHGKEIYPGDDNTEQWKADLEKKYQDYRDFFRTIYPQWKQWRDAQVKATWFTTKSPTSVPPFFYWVAHGETVDCVTLEEVKYKEDWNANEQTFKGVSEAAQTRMRNQAVAEMAGVMASSFLLQEYVPGKENNPPDVDPNLTTFSMGPYSLATLGRNGKGDYSTDIVDGNGHVKSILVREWNSIDGMQLNYLDHAGQFVGNPRGGAPHTIEAGNNHFIGLKMLFAQNILCRVETYLSDGSSSGRLGNRGGWSGAEATATVDSSYELVGAKYRKGKGPSSTVGISVLELQYQHSSLVKR